MRYVSTGKTQAADALENCALRSRKNAVDVAANSKISQMLGSEAVAGPADGPQRESTKKKKKGLMSFKRLSNSPAKYSKKGRD